MARLRLSARSPRCWPRSSASSRPRGYTFVYAKGYSYSARVGSLRELPCDERALRRLDARSHARPRSAPTATRRSTRSEVRESRRGTVLALVLLHDRHLPGQHRDHQPEPPGDGGAVSRLSRSDRRPASDRTPKRRGLVHPLSRPGRAPVNARDGERSAERPALRLRPRRGGRTPAVLVTIVEHKQEGGNPFFRVVDIRDTTRTRRVGEELPFQYDGYLRTWTRSAPASAERGPARIPTTPTRAPSWRNPFDEDPRLRRCGAGYAFRGFPRLKTRHAYMLADQMFPSASRRRASRDLPALPRVDVRPYLRARRRRPDPRLRTAQSPAVRLGAGPRAVTHRWLIDCQTRARLQLRITRPGFLEGIRRAQGLAGDPGLRPNTMATRQEMRAYVCGQCHVEYYFRGPEKRLSTPGSAGCRDKHAGPLYTRAGSATEHAETGAPC